MRPPRSRAGFTPVWRSAEHGFTPSLRSAERGFTLVEVMVALLIFSLLAVAGVAILSFSARANAAQGAHLDASAALARTAALLSADCGEALDRPARDETGTVRPAFTGGGDPEQLMTLVRGGWTNLDGAPRASIEKVAWRLAGDGLERIAWPAVDGAEPGPPSLMMPGIVAARVRFRVAGAWADRFDGEAGVPLPQAAELLLIRRDGQQYRLACLIGGDPPLPGPAA